MEIKGHPMLKKPQPMNVALKQHNVHKYCEFHEQNGHTTAECRELKKAFYELADKWQIDWFLKGCARAFLKDLTRACEEPQEEDCSTKIMATITRIKAQAISTIASADPKHPHPETINDLETVLLEEERPDRTVRLGREMT